MKRRALLAGLSGVAISGKAGAVGYSSGAEQYPGVATIAAAFFPTTNVIGGDYMAVSLRFTGAAPTSISSATWSGGGGSGTILSSSFAHTGQTVQFMVSTPSPGSTTTYSLALTADTGASVTLTGISVLKPVVDMAPGIYGPTTVYWDQSQPIRNNSFSLLPLAAYFTRGLPGPLSVTVTDTAPASGDAAYFSLSSKLGGYAGGLTTGFNLCPTYALLGRTTQTSYAITINVSNGISALSLPVTVNRPATNAVAVYAWDTIYGGAYFTHFLTNQILVDTTKPQAGGSTIDAVQLLTNAASIAFTPDSGGLFSFTGGNNGTVQVAQGALIAANYGHHTCTIQATGGPVQTLDFWILATRPPVAAWRPNGSIYSSTPATTGFVGSNLIGTIAAYSDEHGQVSTSSYFRYEIVSDSSGALQVWNDGSVYLSGAVSAGTIDAVVRVTSLSGIAQLLTLSLPVLAGTTLAASNIVPSISGSLTNFVPYANPLRNGSTSFPYGTPVLVGTFTVSGFSNPIDWTNVQTCLPLGPTYDVSQEANGGDPTNLNAVNGFDYNIPRYIVAGSGTSGTIHATNLSAIDDVTPQVDTLRVQLTDGLGTYCTKDIPVSVAWHTAPTPNVSVGPGGDFATPLLMGHAFWDDFNANGAASQYAGTRVKALPGCDVIQPNGFCYGPGGGSGFSAGWMPYPLVYDPGVISSWGGNATIAGTTLTINSTSSGAIEAGQYFTSGVGSAKVMVMSGSGATWTVHVGPDPISTTLSVGPATMATALPRIDMDFAKTAPGGSQQGGLIKNGYDLVIYRSELWNCTLAWGGDNNPGPNVVNSNTNAAAVYMIATSTGNLAMYKCYLHDSDVGILNGGPGIRVTVEDCMIMKCGNGSGTQHSVYTDIISLFTFKRNQCNDTLAGLDFKTRAVQVDATDNVIVDGVNGQGSTPVNFTFNGNMQFLRNIVIHTMNDVPAQASQSHNLQNEINGGQGVTGDSVGWLWPYQNTVIDGCTYYNLIPHSVSPFQEPQIWSSFGTQLQVTTGSGGMQADPLRNTPVPTTITNTAIGNFNFPDEYFFTFYGGVAPTLGSGNTTSPLFPASAIRLIDPITGTPPFRLPRQGPFGYFFGGHRTSTFGSSPGTYYMAMTVPSGSPTGTDVIGGAITAYDGNWDSLGSPTYSFNNDFTTDNASFSMTTVGGGIQLKTVGALADGLYTVTVQCIGTGWNSNTQVSGSITSISSFRVVVGGYV